LQFIDWQSLGLTLLEPFGSGLPGARAQVYLVHVFETQSRLSRQ
jgi:hypothetical protein